MFSVHREIVTKNVINLFLSNLKQVVTVGVNQIFLCVTCFSLIYFFRHLHKCKV